MAATPVEIDTTRLLAVRDELAVVKDIVAGLCLACSSPILPRDERAALGQLALLIRERLEALAGLLDGLMPPPATSRAGDRA